jgi:predicted lipoprotein
MNANELADELEDWYKGNQINDTDPVPQAATMLRQQQAEIEALKAKVDGLDMVIWKLQTTLSNRELRTYDGKLK